MQRVMIVGGPGSGKSTLARWLGTRTGLPVYHMDHIHWQAGWVKRPRELRREMAHEIEAREQWIFEGGFSTTYENRFRRADTFIWLDLPVGLRLWRVTKRIFVYWGQVRADLPEGCPEGLHGETAEFYRWIWRTRHSARARLIELLKTGDAGLTVHHLRSRADVAAFQRAMA